MIDVKEAATRKIGPLPAWAWGAVIGGGLIVYRMATGGGGDGGASSPFVQPISGGEPFDFAGGGGGGGGTPTTGVPAPSTPTTPTPRTVLKITSLTNIFSDPFKKHDITGTSGSYYVERVRINGRDWYKITGTVSGAQSTRVGKYIPYYASPSMYTVSQGDTYDAGLFGDTASDSMALPVLGVPSWRAESIAVQRAYARESWVQAAPTTPTRAIPIPGTAPTLPPILATQGDTRARFDPRGARIAIAQRVRGSGPIDSARRRTIIVRFNDLRERFIPYTG